MMPADPTYFPLKRVCAVEGQREAMTYVRGDVVDEMAAALMWLRSNYASAQPREVNAQIDAALNRARGVQP